MQAIILAAGMGKRLKSLTENNTKCMVRVNGVPLIDRMLHQLENRGLSRIVIVVGYFGDKLKEHINSLGITVPIIFIENPIYDKTNNIYSLWLAHDYLCEEDTILFESDLIFEDEVIDILISDPRPTLALVDKYESWMDGTCVKIDPDDHILEFVSGKKFKYSDSDHYYKTVNIYKFSVHFSQTYYVPFLEAYSQALGLNEYYEQVLRVITMLDDSELRAKRLNGQKWYEIDDIQDLDIANSLFPSDDNEQRKLISSRYGGYWRYPKMIDFCYLVNPFYPPAQMLNEMKHNFDRLITQYPSGLRVNRLLAAKNFNVDIDNIVVGNGAAELINILMRLRSGTLGLIRPTFEEYPNRYVHEQLVFTPPNEDFSYSIKDVKDFFDDKDISCLILINPDNPSGNYIPSAELKDLVLWAKQKNISIIIDESFSDFAVDEVNTLIDNGYIKDNPHLCIVKSISKSYGIPGLRLGILVSGDTELIDSVSSEVSIWNINSTAEFYMQISEKYKSDYLQSLEKLKSERQRMLNELSKIEGIRAFDSQANFIMAEITAGITSRELTTQMMKGNVLIKDLSEKIERDGRQFIRVAVRSPEDNNIFIDLLKSILNNIGE